MKIVQVSGFDTLGIQVNGYLLHEYYRARGHKSCMFVHQKRSQDPDVHSLRHLLLTPLNTIMHRLGQVLSLWTILPIEAVQLLFNPVVRKADILHLQLTYNLQFFSILMLPLLSWVRGKKPILVAIHDMFMASGHCVYSLECNRWETGCGSCPHKELPFPITLDTSGFCWWIKKKVYSLARVDLIAGSPWQMRMIARSPILARKPMHYIPYGVDTRHYNLKDKKACRARFRIPEDAHVISFRSVPFGRNFKGTEFIIKALEEYEPKKKTYLLTFEGIGGLDSLCYKYRVLQLPWTNDDQKMIADGLGAADIFLMPSIAEAFGLMAMESLACGTPVIVFDGTALPETIKAPSCGLSVPMGDVGALRDAIGKLLDDEALRQRMMQEGQKLVKKDHTLELYADRFLALYEKLLTKQDSVV
jgi:glycosyltransferase involved in cell wall biosynthesis